MNHLAEIFRARVAAAAVFFAALIAVMPVAGANRLNDKLLNRPYTDQRRFHLGFSVGMNALGMGFHHNGFVTDGGRLNDYFSVRVSPGVWFGNRVVKFLDTSALADPAEYTQDIKSAYVVVPVDLKFAAQRMRNLRPYIVGGVMPAFDVAKKRTDILKTKSSEFFISAGFGCDFYLPYFKFIPEVKFCFGLSDALQHKRPDLAEDPIKQNISNSVKRATTKMIVFTFYFE